jgi:hypothetical protein
MKATKLFAVNGWTLLRKHSLWEYLAIQSPKENGVSMSWAIGRESPYYLPKEIPHGIRESMRAFIRLTQ